MPPSLGVAATVVDRLTPVPLSQRSAIRDRICDPNVWRGIPAFHEVEAGGHASAPARRTSIRIAAWNLERGLFPEQSGRLLAHTGVDLALLSELDVGMLRTGQAHTPARIAEAIGHRYAFGLEFLALTAPPPPPGFPILGNDNREALYGNGLLTALPFDAPAIIRLPDVAGGWDASPATLEPRVGTRLGLAAKVSVGPKQLVACSAHLEARSDPSGRRQQFRVLLDGLDAYAGGLPIVIGGDFNTLVVPGRMDEPLFTHAIARGYDFLTCNPMRPTTRNSHWSRHPGDRQLDWFCVRGLRARDPLLVPAVGAHGEMLSDHERSS